MSTRFPIGPVLACEVSLHYQSQVGAGLSHLPPPPTLHLDYQPFYCEENIWKLCDRGVATGSQVVFISNLNREVLLFEQRAGDPVHGMVAWDYHVILAEPQMSAASSIETSVIESSSRHVWLIRDFDTRLENPCPWSRYRDHTFRMLPDEFARWTPQFRLVDAELFHQMFASDRQHMQNSDGSWMRPPPSWPTIGEGSNLMSFLDFRDESRGKILDLQGLVAALNS